MSRKTHVSVSLPPELLDKLRALARRESRSVSSLVRVLLRERIREWEQVGGPITP